MSIAQWIDIYVIAATAVNIVLLYKVYSRSHSIPIIIFAIALGANVLAYIVELIGMGSEMWFSWSGFLGIVFCICGLLLFIRNSKPVFARFPIFLASLPLMSVLFYPLVMRSLVIDELINAIYQGGALGSALILFSLDHFRNKHKVYFITGILLLALTYFGYWIYPSDSLESMTRIGIISAHAGFVLLSIGFFNRNKTRRK